MAATSRATSLFDNGYNENGPDGQPFTFAGIDFWFWGIGREGISVDGSYDNTIVGNVFAGNSAGGLFLYKNCGEYPDRPAYFERRVPVGRTTSSRATCSSAASTGCGSGHGWARTRCPMDCTDPAYIDEPLRRVVLDRANDNVVRDNHVLRRHLRRSGSRTTATSSRPTPSRATVPTTTP